MILLRTLGASDLAATDRPSAAAVLAQPKRFALLAYLAVAGARGFVRRDSLLALFWPETDQARGRNVLRQTIYLLRQSLGAGVITSRGDEELSVDPSVLQCDVTLFRAALADGQPAAALEHYRGDFMAGFHIPDAAGELEDWIQSERARLRAMATNAAWSLAVSEETAGRKVAAASWARRSLDLDFLNEARVRDVMQLLTRVGDRAGALRAYHDHARRAREDLGMAPGADVERLAQSLRAAGTATAVGQHAPGTPGTAKPTFADAPPAASIPLARTKAGVGRAIAWALPIALAGFLAITFMRKDSGATDTPVIAVGPITDSADRAGTASNVPAELLSTSLARISGVQVIPLTRLYDVQSQLRAAGRPLNSTLAAAKHAGAEELIQGTMQVDGRGAVRMDLQVLDPNTGAVRRVFRGAGNDVFSAVDNATAQIAQSYGTLSPRQSIGDVTTRSLVAYRLYDQALQAYYHDDAPGAYRLFNAVLAEDSLFAMAAYYAALSAPAREQKNAQQRLLRAARLAEHAPDRERLLILERVASAGMSAQANAFADTMVVRYPLDPDAHYAFAQALLRRGDYPGAVREYRRVIELDSLSLSQPARCLACDAYSGLWWVYIYADSGRAAERVAREITARRPLPNSYGLLALSLARLDRTRDALKAWQTADSLRADAVDLDLASSILSIRAGDFAAADERLRRLLREGGRERRSEAAWYLTLSLRNQGRLREALGIAPAAISRIADATVLFEMQRARDAVRIYESMLPWTAVEFPGHKAKHQTWIMTHIATGLAALGDTARLPALADSMERMGQGSAYGRDPRLHHFVRGLLWNARGKPDLAVNEFRASIWSWTDGYTRANYELARTLLALNRPAEAVYPLQAALRGDLEASNLYMARTELHELLAAAFDRLNQPDSAAVHYRAVVNAWLRADPQFNPRLRAAQQRLGALQQFRKASEN